VEGVPGRWGWEAIPGRGLACERNRSCLSHVRYVGLTPSRDLFDCAEYLFVEAKQGQFGALVLFLADQQNKHSNRNQQGNKRPTASERARFRRSSGFDPAPFCAAPMPQKRRLPMAATRRLVLHQRMEIPTIRMNTATNAATANPRMISLLTLSICGSLSTVASQPRSPKPKSQVIIANQCGFLITRRDWYLQDAADDDTVL